MVPVQAPAGDFPEPVIHPYVSSVRRMRSLPAAQTDSRETKKNRANQIARFGAYPSFRILLAISVQKFPVIFYYSYNDNSAYKLIVTGRLYPGFWRLLRRSGRDHGPDFRRQGEVGRARELFCGFALYGPGFGGRAWRCAGRRGFGIFRVGQNFIIHRNYLIH